MIELFKKIYYSILKYTLEEKKLLYFLNKYTKSESSVLDVGCGYGRLLRLLDSKKYHTLGVEINPEIVNLNIADGIHCLTVNDFLCGDEAKKKWDAIIMFHVIEHLSPDDCFKFIDSYLDHLKPNGVLVIATPLFTEYFYEDFDHVKPYLPLGLQMVFGDKNAQVQYHSRNKLQMIDLWYKKYFYRLTNYRIIYFPRYRFIIPIFTAFSALLFKISFGILGKKDGWMAVFRKI